MGRIGFYCRVRCLCSKDVVSCWPLAIRSVARMALSPNWPTPIAPEGDTENVVVNIDYSSLNYIDGMALGSTSIAEAWDLNPGVDVPGTVRDPGSRSFRTDNLTECVSRRQESHPATAKCLARMFRSGGYVDSTVPGRLSAVADSDTSGARRCVGINSTITRPRAAAIAKT